MEPFVQRIIAGGLGLVAGLWIAALLEPGPGPWLLGPVLILGGVAGLASGIAGPIEY
jgi:hypothetical protein